MGGCVCCTDPSSAPRVNSCLHRSCLNSRDREASWSSQTPYPGGPPHGGQEWDGRVPMWKYLPKRERMGARKDWCQPHITQLKDRQTSGWQTAFISPVWEITASPMKRLAWLGMPEWGQVSGGRVCALFLMVLKGWTPYFMCQCKTCGEWGNVFLSSDSNSN